MGETFLSAMHIKCESGEKEKKGLEHKGDWPGKREQPEQGQQFLPKQIQGKPWLLD